MDDILKSRRSAAYAQLCQLQRREAILRVRHQRVLEEDQLVRPEFLELVEMTRAGDHKAATRLGNHLITHPDDRANAVRLGIAEVPLNGELGSWLLDICIYPEAPYDLLGFLPRLNEFLGSPQEKVRLRTLYSLQGVLLRGPTVSDLVFGLSNFSRVREMVASP